MAKRNSERLIGRPDKGNIKGSMEDIEQPFLLYGVPILEDVVSRDAWMDFSTTQTQTQDQPQTKNAINP